MQNLLFILIPSQGVEHKTIEIRNLIEQSLEAYSGLLVAIIYCYLNHEVQVEIGRYIMNTKMRFYSTKKIKMVKQKYFLGGWYLRNEKLKWKSLGSVFHVLKWATKINPEIDPNLGSTQIEMVKSGAEYSPIHLCVVPSQIQPIIYRHRTRTDPTMICEKKKLTPLRLHRLPQVLQAELSIINYGAPSNRNTQQWLLLYGIFKHTLFVMLFIVVKYTVYAKTAFLKYNSIKPVIRDFGVLLYILDGFFKWRRIPNRNSEIYFLLALVR